jgi:hypothetical protein
MKLSSFLIAGISLAVELIPASFPAFPLSIAAQRIYLVDMVLKGVVVLAVLALVAIAIVSPVAVQSLYARQADQQSIDIDDEVLARLERTIWMPDSIEIRDEHGKILKAREDIDHERLVLAVSMNIASSIIENAVRAHIATANIGKNPRLYILIIARSDNETKTYHIVASGISYSFSEDGSTLKLAGNITRSNAPGFNVGKQIVVEVRIGFANIASGDGDAYVNGEIKSLALHHK